MLKNTRIQTFLSDAFPPFFFEFSKWIRENSWKENFERGQGTQIET